MWSAVLEINPQQTRKQETYEALLKLVLARSEYHERVELKSCRSIVHVLLSLATIRVNHSGIEQQRMKVLAVHCRPPDERESHGNTQRLSNLQTEYTPRVTYREGS